MPSAATTSSPGHTDKRRWQTIGQLRLRWRCWEDEHIVFNCNSGDTYLLNPVAAEALKILQESPRCVEELSREVGVKLNIEPNADLYRNLDQFLLKLARLGLIHPLDDSF